MRFETCPRNFRQFLLVPLFALTVSCSGSDDPAPTPEPELPESKLTLEDNQLSFTKDANQSKTITFTTDQKWKIEIPGDSWLRADITAGDPGENITVTLYVKSANDDYPVRKKEVLIETTSGKYKYARVKAKQTGINDQELPYIYVANAGDMKRALEAIPGYANIEALYVKGNIGPADFATLNSMRRLNELSLQDVAIEGNEIPDNAFKGNETLKTFYFPKNITRIGEYAFRGCKNLAGDLYIPYTVEEVDDYAFEECSGLKGNLAFAGTGYPIGVSKLKRIGVAAFNKCKFNGTLTFGVLSELQEIDNYAFHSCKGFIGGLDIPDNVTRIGSYAFYSAFGFTHISLGKKVSSIGVFGFNVEGTCKLIYSHNPVPPTLAAASSLPLLSSSEQTRLIIPSGTTSAYKNAQYWKDRVFDLYLDSL